MLLHIINLITKMEELKYLTVKTSSSEGEPQISNKALRMNTDIIKLTNLIM
jgi:hypothetical protein